MILEKLRALLKLPASGAEMIFDADEPIGQPTDLVLPARRWFGPAKGFRSETRISVEQASHAKSSEGERSSPKRTS
ncbi:MAG: hypothetical protein H0X73_04440 [Chthoniobacterales bacterium]|nr:hypothetical protein [Chthoniobacterales bacterium]